MHENDLKRLFGRRLKNLRQSSSLTQSRLAELAGISEEYLSKLERGLASPSFGVLAQISRILGIHPNEMFRFAVDGPNGSLEGALAEAETVLGSIFDTLPFGVFVSTPSGRFRLASPSFARILGYDNSHDLLAEVSNIATDIYVNPAERDRVLGGLPKNGSTRVYATTFRCKDGSELPVRMSLRRMITDDGSGFFVGVVENVMGRLCTPGLNQEWVHPVAVRDLHHRIKNNFAMLKAYMDLSMAKPELASCREVLRDIGHKIMAVAKVHEKLYGGGDILFLDADAYLKDIITPLSESFSAPLGIEVSLNCEKCKLDWDKALPLGIASVELVTNAIKYAYPGGKGPIKVAFRREGQGYLLSVSDGGVGFSPSGQEESGGFGMTLVQAMVERLRGSLLIDNANGTTVTIRFPGD